MYFEKENIWTLDSKGELMITIMSSMAQEESRSISENVTWGKHKSAADGKISLAYKNFLGYDKGPNGTLIINETEAPIVRRIYKEFMQGKTPFMIASGLTASGIPTPARKEKWPVSTIQSILTNEKYKGSALLQKTYTVDFLTKKLKKNNGEVPQYYIETSHEAIIPPAEWEQVQREIARRRNQGKKYSGSSILASKLVCGDCGGFFGPKVWNSNNPEYRRVIWQCNDKFKGEQKCSTPHFTEEAIKQKFITAFNLVYDMRDEIIANCELAAAYFADCADIDAQRDALMQELEEVTELSRKYDDFPEEDQYRVDGDKEFYSALVHALGVLIADPSKIIYFPIKKAKPYIRPTYENYHLVMARPELQFKRSRWFDIKGRIDRRHWVGKYTFNYNEQKLLDFYEKYKDSDLYWKKPCYPDRRKDYVEQLIGDTVFLILPKEVCYHYHHFAAESLSDAIKGIPNAYDDEYGDFVEIGWLLPDVLAKKELEKASTQITP